MKRRKAREYALQFLFRIDFVNIPAGKSKKTEEVLEEQLRLFWADSDEPDSDVKTFAEDLITGTIIYLERIDSIIQDVTKAWKISRMAAIDRNLLRFAAYELLYRRDIPDAVIINESLEIAKKYSTSESAAFINGILDRISKDYRN